jgi:hypothetical protein
MKKEKIKVKISYLSPPIYDQHERKRSDNGVNLSKKNRHCEARSTVAENAKLILDRHVRCRSLAMTINPRCVKNGCFMRGRERLRTNGQL